MIHEYMIVGRHNALTIRCWIGTERIVEEDGRVRFIPSQEQSEEVLDALLAEAENRLLSTPDSLAHFIAQEVGWTVEVLRPDKTGMVVYATWP